MVDFGIGETLAILSIASAVAGATTSIVSGVQAHKQGQIQAQQADLQAQADKTQAAVNNVQRQKQLAAVLGTQAAMFGSAGIDIGSGTPGVIGQASFDNAQRQAGQEKLFTDVSVGVLGLQKQDSLLAGNYGMVTGFTGAASSLLKAGTGMAQTGSIPGGKSMIDPSMLKPSGGLA